MYSIVTFNKENTCEGVPTSWLRECGDSIFCFWPDQNTNKTRLIKKASDPSLTWEMCKCTVKSTANTYAEMIAERKIVLDMTTDTNNNSSDDELIIDLPRSSTCLSQQLNKKVPTNRTFESDNSGSDYEDEELARPKKKVASSSDHSASSKLPEPPSCIVTQKTPLPNDFEKIMNEFKREIIETMNVGFIETHSQLVNLREEVKIIKRIRRHDAASDAPLLNTTTLPDIPIRTSERMTLLEDILKQTETERINMMAKLSIIGGNTVSGVVNNMMNGVISRELAMSYSLNGRGNKLPFKKLSIFGCIIEALKKNHLFSSVKEDDMLKLISSNLANAKDRVAKVKKAAEKINRTSDDLEDQNATTDQTATTDQIATTDHTATTDQTLIVTTDRNLETTDDNLETSDPVTKELNV